MKELLNKLIKNGRVPFGDKRITNVSWKMQYVGTYNWVFRSNHNVVQFWKSTREIVSKESGLWQFVCENKLLPKKNGYVWNLIDHYDFDKTIKWIGEHNSFYYIIESSLKDESELEDFLLQNIRVGNED